MPIGKAILPVITNNYKCMKRNRLFPFSLVVAATMLLSLTVHAANTNKTVSQVTETVTVTADWNYIVSSATPFGEAGIVNLENTEHAVLILSKVKPSSALSLLAAHVQIAGEKAVNGTNCQVKMYNRGAIILPYGNSIKPLTVYSEQNFGGTAVNEFGLEHSGGFMNTLSAAKLNNKRRSFKLKRGYMVTFSTLPSGRGYSRCFIAAYNDLEFKTLPAVLDQKISSYRIFKWYDFSKAALANDTRKAACDALNVQGCYSFSLGEDRGIDCECVPHHIYEDWPSAAACGQVTYSPHLKTNNEPGNSADDHPQTVDEVLANWENLMATGKRLCSPSSHDGSLYHLRNFLDSIDARGWRCDIIDIHSYWDKGQFNNLSGWSTDYKNRPVWVSEWVWGASWNNNGIFNTGTYNRDNPGDKEYSANKTAVSEICNNMNNQDRVERYFYWNSEANCSKLYRDGKLTPAGEWYASQNPGLGYKTSYSYTPTVPAQMAPSKLVVSYDKTTMTSTLTWNDRNGEFNNSMVVERSTDGGSTWETIATPTQQEKAASYQYDDTQSRDGYKYRIHIVDLNSKDRYSSVQVATLLNPSTGDAVTVDGKTMYIGGNVLVNGDFEMGMQGWTNGEGNPIAAPYFQLLTAGGPDEGHYLIGWANQTETAPGSLVTNVGVTPDSYYYLSVMLKNTGGAYQSVKAGSTLLFNTQTKSDWAAQDGHFNVGSNNEITISFRWLNKGCIDKMMLCRLFDTQEAAYSDALVQTRKRMEAFVSYNTEYAGLNAELLKLIDTSVTADAEGLKVLEDAFDAAVYALNQMPVLQRLCMQAATAIAIYRPGSEAMKPLVDEAAQVSQPERVPELISELQIALDALDPFTVVDNAVKNATFATTDYWVKTSTYEGGDQRKNTVLGMNCWNAWWAVSTAAAGDKTLSIQQTVNNLPEGYYYLENKATTEHYCLSDQHAFISTDYEKALSPALTYDRFDYPGLDNAAAWETLATAPLYVGEGGTLTVGFESSKNGAVDGQYIPGGSSLKPDYREGWWCATDFKLYRLPLYRRTLSSAGQWGTISLQYDYKPGVGVQLYEVAGLLTEGGQDYICLEPVAEQKAGHACVFFSEYEHADFFESGEAAKWSQIGKNSLWGDYSNATYLMSYDIGSLVLVDGMWYALTAEDIAEGGSMTMIPKSEAYLLEGRAGLTVLSSWSGVKLPLSSEILTGISAVNKVSNTSVVESYTISGRPAGQSDRGIQIRRQNGKVQKVVVK